MMYFPQWSQVLKPDRNGFEKPDCFGFKNPTPQLLKVGTLIPTLFLLLSMASTAFSQSPLADSLTAYLQRLPAIAHMSLAIKSLTDNTIAFSHYADERVPSASVIKLPIMLEVMEQVKAGSLDLEAVHVLKNTEKTGGDGILKNQLDGSRVSYRELLRLMMVHSDNTATNIFINKLGRDAINKRIRAIGLTKSQLNRVMMDTLAARQGRENYVTASEMSTLMEKIYRHQVASPDLCDQMLTILKQNDDTTTIPRLLPKGTVIAHKTGTLTYVRGDVGIVYPNDGLVKGSFLLSVFVEGVPTSEAERIIGEVARICYAYFSR